MTTPATSDLLLESLRDELRTVLVSLNELHHPVYPSSPVRIAEIERRADELRAQIVAVRRELVGSGAAPPRP